MCEMLPVTEDQNYSFLPSSFKEHVPFYEILVHREFKEKVLTSIDGRWMWYEFRLDGESLPVLIYQTRESVALVSQYAIEETSALVASLCISFMVFNRMMWEFQENGLSDWEAFEKFFFLLKQWVFSENNSYLSLKDKRVICSFID